MSAPIVIYEGPDTELALALQQREARRTERQMARLRAALLAEIARLEERTAE